MISNLLILCHPLLLPSIFPSIRVFPNELTLYIRWPNYWNFSFSINPSSEYSGVFSSRIAPKKEICHCFHFSLICLPWCDGATLHDFSFFVYWVLSQIFHTPFSPSSKDSLVSLCFLPLGWCHLYIWGCWYFSWWFWSQLVIHPAWHFAWGTLDRC